MGQTDEFAASSLIVRQAASTMAKQKFRPPRRSGFSGTKAYIKYVKILKNYRNTGGRTFCDAIKITFSAQLMIPAQAFPDTWLPYAGRYQYPASPK